MLSLILMAALGAVNDTPARVAPSAARLPCKTCYSDPYNAYYGGSYFEPVGYYGAPQGNFNFMGGCNSNCCPSLGDVNLFFPCPPCSPCAPRAPLPPCSFRVNTYSCPTPVPYCPYLPPPRCQ